MIVPTETNKTIYKQIIWNSVISITDLSLHSKMFAVMIYYITGLPTKDETLETTIRNVLCLNLGFQASQNWIFSMLNHLEPFL